MSYQRKSDHFPGTPTYLDPVYCSHCNRDSEDCECVIHDEGKDYEVRHEVESRCEECSMAAAEARGAEVTNR